MIYSLEEYSVGVYITKPFLFLEMLREVIPRPSLVALTPERVFDFAPFLLAGPSARRVDKARGLRASCIRVLSAGPGGVLKNRIKARKISNTPHNIYLAA
jgi:hypothetical protein